MESGEWRFILLFMIACFCGFLIKGEHHRLEWRVESGEWRFILLYDRTFPACFRKNFRQIIKQNCVCVCQSCKAFFMPNWGTTVNQAEFFLRQTGKQRSIMQSLFLRQTGLQNPNKQRIMKSRINLHSPL